MIFVLSYVNVAGNVVNTEPLRHRGLSIGMGKNLRKIRVSALLHLFESK
jgi:hypothetical protein